MPRLAIIAAQTASATIDQLPPAYEKYLNSVYYGTVEGKPIEDDTVKGAIAYLNKNVGGGFEKQLAYLLTLIRYRDDMMFAFYGQQQFFDGPQSADITLMVRSGDCEDFARVVACIGAHMGYKSYILLMLHGNSGHAVGVIEKDGKFFAYDIYDLTTSSSIGGIARKYSSKYSVFFLYDFTISEPITRRVKFAALISPTGESYVITPYVALNTTPVTSVTEEIDPSIIIPIMLLLVAIAILARG
jgi:hypothetical protein